LNLVYKAALSCFTLSGTHSSNFFDFCESNHKIYYLYKNMEQKPDSGATVVAELSDEFFMESSDLPSSTISSVSKCKQDNESVIVEAIKEL